MPHPHIIYHCKYQSKNLLLCPLRVKISNHLPPSYIYINFIIIRIIKLTGYLESRISRRDFLKLMGALGIVSLGGFGSLIELYKKRGSSSVSSSPPLVQTAFAQTTGGSWSLGQNTTVVAIHAALTYTGKIFYYAGSGNCINNQNNIKINTVDLFI